VSDADEIILQAERADHFSGRRRRETIRGIAGLNGPSSCEITQTASLRYGHLCNDGVGEFIRARSSSDIARTHFALFQKSLA